MPTLGREARQTIDSGGTCVRGEPRLLHNLTLLISIGSLQASDLTGSAIANCPDLGPANDQFVLQDGKLAWFTRSRTLWSHDQALRAAAAPTETVDCP